MSSERSRSGRFGSALHQQALSFVLGFILLAACTELIAFQFGLPHVPAILSGLGKLWASGTLIHDMQVSGARWIAGWGIGATVGIALGFVTGRVKVASVALEGLLTLCRAIPFISLVPLSIRIFGLSETGKIFLVAWACAGVCWVIVHQASRAVPPHLAWRSQSLGATPEKWVLRVLLPSCRDGIHSALRASLSLGLIVVAVAELAGVYERSSGRWWSEGLGYRLFRSLDEARDDFLLATILTFALLGIVVDQVFVGLWHVLGATRFRFVQWRVRALVSRARSVSHVDEPNGSDALGLSVTSLNAGYDGHMVLHELSLVVPPGRTLSIVGPSGCGKTTLIRAIAHFTDGAFHVSGSVSIAGKPVAMPGPDVGVVLQDAPVFEHMTVWDNVMFGSSFDREDLDQASWRVWELLQQFGLEALSTQRAGTLSGGQRQRLALAAAVANRPKLLLLDEPFGALDALTRRQLQRFFWQHVNGRVTAVFVTHDLEESLIVGDDVRVGVAALSSTIPVEKGELPPHEWELLDDFARLRGTIITALERGLPKSGL